MKHQLHSLRFASIASVVGVAVYDEIKKRFFDNDHPTNRSYKLLFTHIILDCVLVQKLGMASVDMWVHHIMVLVMLYEYYIDEYKNEKKNQLKVSRNITTINELMVVINELRYLTQYKYDNVLLKMNILSSIFIRMPIWYTCWNENMKYYFTETNSILSMFFID